MLKYGPGHRVVKVMVWLFWPIIIAGKKFNTAPVLKWIINPFFKRPYNELTSIPLHINLKVPDLDSVMMPHTLVERILAGVDEKFVLNECICRGHNKVSTPPADIGCFVLGPAVKRIHPSNGRMVTTEEAYAHLNRAREAGLIPNIAHVWIDPLAYWTTFDNLLFICLCDDDNCLYRTHLKKRGVNLDNAYKKLDGIHIDVNTSLCNGCGLCAEKCFVNAIQMTDAVAHITESCKGCGRCADICPQHAISVTMDNEETVYRQILDRIKGICTLEIKPR